MSLGVKVLCQLKDHVVILYSHVYLLSIGSRLTYCVQNPGKQFSLLWRGKVQRHFSYIDTEKLCGLKSVCQQHFQLSRSVSIATLWFSLLCLLLFASIPSSPMPCTCLPSLTPLLRHMFWLCSEQQQHFTTH